MSAMRFRFQWPIFKYDCSDCPGAWALQWPMRRIWQPSPAQLVQSQVVWNELIRKNIAAGALLSPGTDWDKTESAASYLWRMERIQRIAAESPLALSAFDAASAGEYAALQKGGAVIVPPGRLDASLDKIISECRQLRDYPGAAGLQKEQT